jgi:putative SOS response-associated peptidase YedK
MSYGAWVPQFGEDDMCGRFVCSKAPEVYGSFYDVVAPAIAPNFNVAPTTPVPVIKIENDQRTCVLQRWGLIPSWAKDKKMSFINARADTLFEKPAFRAAAKRRRCLILADGYFEWKAITAKQKQPYYLRPTDGNPIAFAGVWETWKGEGDPVDSCAIITTDANELTRPIHDRMPVILRGADAEVWIDPHVEDPTSLAEILRPFPAEMMTCFAVGPAVGNVKNKGPQCIEPMET